MVIKHLVFFVADYDITDAQLTAYPWQNNQNGIMAKMIIAKGTIHLFVILWGITWCLAEYDMPIFNDLK